MTAVPASFVFREGTNDVEIFRDVCDYNEYRLPDAFGPEDIVVDIGMHIGSFCYAAAQRGAGRVYGFEPDPDNYERAVENLRPFADRVSTYHMAMWRSDRPAQLLRLTRSTDAANRAGGGVLCGDQDRGLSVPSVRFDDFIREITGDGERRVACLKIDCEGAEFPILLTSRYLHLIDYICGEFHEFWGEIPEHASVPGFERFTITELTKRLNQNGFTVDAMRYQDTHLGIFFAMNSSDLYLMQQLNSLRRHHELQPHPGSGAVARLRAKLAWWLLAPEMRQINETHAATLRILDSLVARLERERTSRR